MIPVDEARTRILQTVVRQPAEVVSVDDALGRVLAEDVTAEVDVPPWDNSAMDGYAVRAIDTVDGGADFVINEVVHAGRAPRVVVTPGTATGVMTGAPMPEGADAVVIVEDSERLPDGRVRLGVQAAPGKWVRRRGCDVRAGRVVLTKGTALTPARVGVAASVGRADLAVSRRPRVAVLTTGDEVVRPGQPLRPGCIHGSNHLTLLGLAREAGAVGVDAGHVGDEPEALRAALLRAVDADVVVTTGGVSVGEADHVKDVLASLGVQAHFWKVRMKPGKPLAFGVLHQDGRAVPVFGLPGNPVSCMVNFLQFVRPWLRMSLGDRTPHLPVVHARCVDDLRSRPGRARLERVALERTDEGLVCRSTGDQSSGILSSMARGHGLVLIGPDEAGPVAGDEVRVQVYDPGFDALADVQFGW